jgi:hypothetical protein
MDSRNPDNQVGEIVVSSCQFLGVLSITRNKFNLFKMPRCINPKTTNFDAGKFESQPIFTNTAFFHNKTTKNKVFLYGFGLSKFPILTSLNTLSTAFNPIKRVGFTKI